MRQGKSPCNRGHLQVSKSINIFLLMLQGAFVAIVYNACAPPQNPFLSQPLVTRTTRERSFKDLTGSPHRECV